MELISGLFKITQEYIGRAKKKSKFHNSQSNVLTTIVVPKFYIANSMQ